MAIFKKLNRFAESIDEKEYERDMREELKDGSQNEPLALLRKEG